MRHFILNNNLFNTVELASSVCTTDSTFSFELLDVKCIKPS